MPKRIRRTWTINKKREIIAEANQPGAIKKAVAAKHGIAESLIYQWQKELAKRDHLPGFDALLDGLAQSIKEGQRLRLAAIRTCKTHIDQCDREIAQLQSERSKSEDGLKKLLDGEEFYQPITLEEAESMMASLGIKDPK